MKILIAFLLLSGCASNPSLYNSGNNPDTEWLRATLNPRYASYDPCFKCGQGWGIQIPNKRFEDQEEVSTSDW